MATDNNGNITATVAAFASDVDTYDNVGNDNSDNSMDNVGNDNSDNSLDNVGNDNSDNSDHSDNSLDNVGRAGWGNLHSWISGVSA